MAAFDPFRTLAGYPISTQNGRSNRVANQFCAGLLELRPIIAIAIVDHRNETIRPEVRRDVFAGIDEHEIASDPADPCAMITEFGYFIRDAWMVDVVARRGLDPFTVSGRVE